MSVFVTLRCHLSWDQQTVTTKTVTAIMLSGTSYYQSHLAQMLKQVVVTFAVVTVCWSYDIKLML